jgi:hypothetical protein
MSYNEQETEEVEDSPSLTYEVWQQREDLSTVARLVELRRNLKDHVQVLDAAAAAIGDIMSTLEESASPLARVRCLNGTSRLLESSRTTS